MAGENRILGRGLGALLGSTPTAPTSRNIGTLPVTALRAGAHQPRHAMTPESLQELATSIRTNGVIQAIVVRRLPDEQADGVRYEIIAGERRWQAAKLAGLAEIPAVVRELSDREALAIGLIENIQREELTATDEARALKRLVTEFSLTQQAVADSVGRSRAAVANLMRLLELPARVIDMIDAKTLGMGHARALLSLENPADQEQAAASIVSRELSVRETEALVRQMIEGPATSTAKRRAVITEVFSTASVKARLHQEPTGNGKIVIDFAGPVARDQLLELIRHYESD